jgi:O-antigen ligase
MIGLLVVLCIVAPIVPLFVNPFDGYDPVITALDEGVVLPRLAATAVFTGAALIWGAVLVLRGRTLSFDWPRTLQVALALFVAVNVLALVFAEDWRASLIGERLRYQGLGATLLYVLLFGVAAFSIRTARELRTVVIGLFIGAAIAAGYALVQKAGLDWITWAGRELDRPSSTVGQANTFAAFLVLAINVSLFLLPRETARWRELAPWAIALALGWLAVVVLVLAGVPTGVGAIVAIAITIVLVELAIAFAGPRALVDTVFVVGIVVMLTALLFTISRSGYLALFVSAMIWAVAGTAWFLFVRRGRQPSVGAIGAIAGGALALTIAAVVIVPLTVKGLDCAGVSFGRYSERLEEAADFDTTEIATRRGLWSLAWEMTLDRPVLGYGQDAFSVMFPRYRDSADLPGIRTESVDPESAHNFFLDLSSGTGFVGLLSFLFLLATVLTISGKKLLSSDDASARVGILALLAACSGYLVAIVLGFSEALTSWAFWLLLGALVGVSVPFPVERENAERPGVASKIAPLALAATGLVAVVWAGTLITANLYAGVARDELTDGDSTTAQRLAARAVTLNPLDRGYLLLEGSAYEQSATELGAEEAFTRAIDVYEKALERFEPNYTTALNLALAKQRLYDATGVPVEEMFDDLEYAVALDEYNTCLHRFVADVYILEGEYQRAFKHGLRIFFFSFEGVLPFCPSIVPR